MPASKANGRLYNSSAVQNPPFTHIILLHYTIFTKTPNYRQLTPFLLKFYKSFNKSIVRICVYSIFNFTFQPFVYNLNNEAG